MSLRPLPCLLLVALGGACQQAPHHPPTAPDAIELWHGGDPLAEGWRMAGPGAFLVEGNRLRTTGGMGLLWYAAQDFADFRLDLDWQVEDPSNNAGVFLRFPDPGNDPWIAVNQGYEVQICDTVDNLHQTGAIYSFQGPTAVPTKAPGEWNHYTITVRGQRYTVDLNGVRVNEFLGSRGERGFIGLQNHDDGSPVRFRNLRVTPL